MVNDSRMPRICREFCNPLKYEDRCYFLAEEKAGRKVNFRLGYHELLKLCDVPDETREKVSQHCKQLEAKLDRILADLEQSEYEMRMTGRMAPKYEPY